jgi:hypothetical protein
LSFAPVQFAAQAGISSSVVDQGLAAIEKIPEPQLKAAATKVGQSTLCLEKEFLFDRLRFLPHFFPASQN